MRGQKVVIEKEQEQQPACSQEVHSEHTMLSTAKLDIPLRAAIMLSGAAQILQLYNWALYKQPPCSQVHSQHPEASNSKTAHSAMSSHHVSASVFSSAPKLAAIKLRIPL
ncbi:hypothetical protein HAX54_048609 [Datura stramonium]|uniref:Uncharacterized protein n=1 Tax=Datura stramonium TaxID=4076 RepID=A0ABS8STW8_DATST|nr:hypothetical protein [Datura stramonium]